MEFRSKVIEISYFEQVAPKLISNCTGSNFGVFFEIDDYLKSDLCIKNAVIYKKRITKIIKCFLERRRKIKFRIE